MKYLIALFLITPLIVANTERGITQEPFPEPSYETTGKKASLVPPLSLPKPPRYPSAPLSPDTSWVPIDSFAFEQLIPAGQRFAISFDYATKTLKDTLLPDFKLSPLAESAIAKAPDWLKWDLTDKFYRLDSLLQKKYANLILNCPDSRYLDEVCFQIAHLSTQTLTNLNPKLLVNNVEWIYKIAPDLKYVKLVESGNPAQGGNYYTTTKYQIKRNGTPVWVEIPKEIYYWWIVEPRCSDEEPLMDATVFNKFWREYLYTYADSTYPLLKNVLSPVTILWDESTHVWKNWGQGFGDSLMAIQAVGRWVARTLPRAASGNRPIQPNQLLRDHDGNCGENQDLLCAGMRTALIPNISVMDINEDHVWNEVWWNNEFYANQVDLGGGVTHIGDFSVALDKDLGGGKECSCIWDWRADGFQWSSIMRYSKFCTLTVFVVDKNGNPIDGVNVNIDSKGWGTNSYWKGFAGATDRNGIFTTFLGNSQDYRLTLRSNMGSKSLGVVIDSASCTAGAHFYLAETLAGAQMPKRESFQTYELKEDAPSGQVLFTLPSPENFYCIFANDEVNVASEFVKGRAVLSRGTSTRPAESYRLSIDYEVPYEVIYGKEYTYTHDNLSHGYAFQKTGGAIDFFIVDRTNLNRYLHSISEKTPVLPEPLVVLGSLPNPSRAVIHIRYKLSKPGKVQFRIFDLKGSLVQTLTQEAKKPGEQVATWDCRDFPAGIYFSTCQLEGSSAMAVQTKLILIK